MELQHRQQSCPGCCYQHRYCQHCCCHSRCSQHCCSQHSMCLHAQTDCVYKHLDNVLTCSDRLRKQEFGQCANMLDISQQHTCNQPTNPNTLKHQLQLRDAPLLALPELPVPLLWLPAFSSPLLYVPAGVN